MRVTLIYDPASAGMIRQVDEFAAAASSFGVEFANAAVRNSNDIERSIEALADAPNPGLIVASNPATNRYLELILMPA
jgi:ABC-type uncharacterized transport system substrate-binding protein